jgi:hypothetical protein
MVVGFIGCQSRLAAKAWLLDLLDLLGSYDLLNFLGGHRMLSMALGLLQAQFIFSFFVNLLFLFCF